MTGSIHPFPSHRLRALLTALVLAGAACGGGAATPPAGGGIDREVFISTYVDLRAAVIRGDSFAISDGERSAILARHGVTEELLLGFAELHGEDPAFMRDVWDEVEARLDGQRVLPDTEPTASPAPDTVAADPVAPPRGPARQGPR